MLINNGIKLMEYIVNQSSIGECKYFSKGSNVGEVLKTPKKIDDFIDILEDDEHGLKKFTEQDRSNARVFFKYNNYYKFSIYPKLLPKNAENEKWNFIDALFLFDLDNYLRKEITDIVLNIEMSVKTNLAHELCHLYDSEEYQKAECYLDKEIYVNSKVANKILNNFSVTVKDSKEEYIKYHHKKRHGCIPFWVLVEELTFGQVDTFIGGLEKSIRTKWLIAVYGKENVKFALSWISVTRYVRNIVAHNSRLYGKTFVVQPKLRREDMNNMSITNTNKNTLFVMLFVLKCMVEFQSNDLKDKWNLFIDGFSMMIMTNKKLVDFEILGFTKNWKEKLKIE